MTTHYNIETLQGFLKQYGRYAFSRFCAKRGIPLDVCHYVVTGSFPKFAF